MRFMVLMIPGVYRGNKELKNFVPRLEDMGEMGKFNDDLKNAGLLVDAIGVHPLSKGARVTFADGKPNVQEGAAVKTTEVFGGYWMLEAKSKEDVVNWMKKCPAKKDDIIEIRPVFEEADFR